MDVRRLAVRVTPEAARHVRRGAPAVFDRSIVSVRPEGVAGDLAVVFDERGRFVAVGLYDPGSPVRVKVLHAGRPQPIDDTFWAGLVSRALERRAALVADPGTTAYRVLNGESDGVPGLVLDRYDDVLVAKVYSAAWFPHLEALVAAAGTMAPRAVVLRLSRSLSRAGRRDGEVLAGALAGGPVVRFAEHGLVFEADVVHGPKTGHFLDQRDNRALVGRLAGGARVLDVFSSTGGFTVHAAAGGARSVHAVDQSAPALAVLARNVAHNRHHEAVRRCRVRTTAGDAFSVLAGLSSDRYDLVVVDPPSFAANRASVERARRAYAALTRLAVGVVAPGGVLVQASCSSRVGADDFFDTVHRAARAAGVVLHERARTGHALDHPADVPEAAYLKALVAEVHPRR